MTLKINPTLIVEKAVDINDNNLLLSGPYLNNQSFSSIYEDDDQLFYHASLIVDGKEHLQEIGLGTFKKGHVHRDKPLYQIDCNKNFKKVTRFTNFNCSNNDKEYILIKSHIPSTVQEVLYEPNTIVTCDVPHIMSPLTIQQNSFLARLNGDLVSVSLNYIANVLSGIKKAIKLSCSLLEVIKIRTTYLQLKSASKNKNPKGTIIYDGQDDCIKYYNGSEWRTLVWREDANENT